MCFDKRVIAGLAVVGLGVYAFAPDLIGAALPLLILAVCPLSMLLMMKMMAPGGSKADAAAADGQGDEVAALRAEVEKLRADQGLLDRRAGETL